MGLVDFQEVAENMMAWTHYHSSKKEEVVEGNKNEGGLVRRGHIPEATTLSIKAFGIDRMDRFRMLGRKGE